MPRIPVTNPHQLNQTIFCICLYFSFPLYRSPFIFIYSTPQHTFSISIDPQIEYKHKHMHISFILITLTIYICKYASRSSHFHLIHKYTLLAGLFDWPIRPKYHSHAHSTYRPPTHYHHHSPQPHSVCVRSCMMQILII